MCTYRNGEKYCTLPIGEDDRAVDGVTAGPSAASALNHASLSARRTCAGLPCDAEEAKSRCTGSLSRGLL